MTQSTTEEAAIDIAAFVSIFFEHFTKFKGRAFHMAGESYGVRACHPIWSTILTHICRADTFQSLRLRSTTKMPSSFKPD